MKVTKKDLEIGMRFECIEDFKCQPVWFENVDSKEYATEIAFGNDALLEVGDTVTVTEKCRKYYCGHGYTGDMVFFKINGHEEAGEHVMFWINFKKHTNFVK